MEYLAGGVHDLADEVAQLERGDVAFDAHLLPGGGAAGGGLLGLPAGVGQREHAAASVSGLGADELLVLELLERRVDGARARAPDASAALSELAHDLVAVHGLLGQQRENRGADIAAPGARAAAEEAREAVLVVAQIAPASPAAEAARAAEARIAGPPGPPGPCSVMSRMSNVLFLCDLLIE